MTIVGTSVPYYLEAGGGERAVLMLHGIGGGHQAFLAQMPALAQAGWRAVSWDMPGYGYSRSIEPYTIAGLAEACLDLIDVLDVRELVLLGHSMGGMIAQEVALRRPEAVAGLVLAGTTAAFGRPEGDWQKAFLAARTAPLDAGLGMAQLAEGLVGQMLAAGASAAARAAATACMASVPSATYRHALAALVAFDRRAELSRLAVPVLLIAGEEDQNAPPAVMQKMASGIAGAQYAVIPNAGHLMPWEQPEAFNRLVVDFLNAHFPSGATPERQ